ncbi:polysaccharide pyruvyl transferase family protein [Collimonas antrihumi]|uniref:polysaccharide pyruvyl transferase family protein n=1 Tax=Collimonas antrihumi TaxID=1940615 RepID=UPI001B8C6D92|nr:polysaccharide pyruvyl transferase family protein [Collimonas antrihumi]
MKIVICAVPYSPNLGDGVIYENIRQLLLERVPNADISALDIAGRDDFSVATVSRKSLINKVPKLLQPSAVCLYFGLQYILRWRRKWTERLTGANLVMIGGGQLLLDVHLNFPVKLFLLSCILKSIGKSGKVAVFGVGVSPSMSAAGTWLLRRTWRNLAPVYVSTRDSASAENLRRILARPLDVNVMPDPGIYSRQTYAAFLAQRSPGSILGICISSPLELNQSDMEKQDYGRRIGAYFLELVRQASASGYRVHLFTNGAPEDEALKDRLAADLGPGQVHNLPRPVLPSELVANISRCDSIIAHRLHANIVAYSLDIPSIGLSWDSKVQSFFALTGRDDFFIRESVPDVADTLKLLQQAPRAGAGKEKGRLTQLLTAEISALLNDSGLAATMLSRESTAGTGAA